jgi:uncharacterized protein (TIGR02172 family)
MQKGEIVGIGMTAEVYEWDSDKVLKLYYDWYPKDWIENEAQIGCLVYKAGISAPAIYDVVDIENRKGIIFDRINGKTIFKLIESKPWKIVEFAKCMAKLHTKIHDCKVAKLPSQNERFTHIIKNSSKIDDKTKNHIINYLKKLPGGSSLCHGDFHPDNIIASNKKLVAIDWVNTYKGNFCGDIARTCLTIKSPVMPPESSKGMRLFSKILKWLFHYFYLKEYMKITKVKYESIDAWILPIAAVKLSEEIPGEEKWLKSIIKKRLAYI